MRKESDLGRQDLKVGSKGCPEEAWGLWIAELLWVETSRQRKPEGKEGEWSKCKVRQRLWEEGNLQESCWFLRLLPFWLPLLVWTFCVLTTTPILLKIFNSFNKYLQSLFYAPSLVLSTVGRVWQMLFLSLESVPASREAEWPNLFGWASALSLDWFIEK